MPIVIRRCKSEKNKQYNGQKKKAAIDRRAPTTKEK
jgi:hypothetical protein